MPPLYQRLLGPQFDALAPQVRTLHDVRTLCTWRGEAQVKRGTHLMSRFAGWATGLPPAGQNVPLVLRIYPETEGERWLRAFGTSVFATRQFARGDHLCERAGPVTFLFRLVVKEGTLSFALVQARVFGIPLPGFLATKVSTREWEEDGRYCFDAAAEMPFFGLLVHYRGWLVQDPERPAELRAQHARPPGRTAAHLG